MQMRGCAAMLGAAVGLWSSFVHAGQVATRAQLNALLGPSPRLENFETFPAADNSTYALDHPILDSTTIEHGHGPGLVAIDDVAFNVVPEPSVVGAALITLGGSFLRRHRPSSRNGRAATAVDRC